MKRLRNLLLLLLFLPLAVFAQSMSDNQVLELIKRETAAGSSRSQIVTKLVQRGVNIDQIRRVRAQYEKQIRTRGLSGAADEATSELNSRMRSNNSEITEEITSGKNGSKSQFNDDADLEYEESVEEGDVDASVSGMENKKVFGHDIFNNKLLSFEPNMNIATPQDYVLGPGDQLVIDIYGASQKSYQLTVSPEGTVTVPDFGPITVSGMTVAAANSRIRASLGSRYSSSSLKVSVGQTRTILINVMGEVNKPGTYHLSAFASVFHALYAAGGIGDLGTLRNVKVLRGGNLVTIVDIYEYILNGRLAGNIRLKDGDVISVGAYDCLVNVTGNVKRPMYYEMRANESVSTLLKYAGGFSGDAYRKSVRLIRKTGERFGVFNIGEFEQASFKVADGDAVQVDAMLERFENMVEVSGAVFRPGQYRLGEQVTTVRSLIEQADGLTEDAFTAHAVLHRMRADRSLEVIPVDVAGIMGGTVADIPLANEDVLFIPTQAELISNRYVQINGEVLSPGQYQWAANMTIEDLVMKAGGLTDAASVAKVTVSRRLVDPKATMASSELSKTFSFELKDGFVIDGTPGFMLEPYDIVQVFRSPGFHTPRQITIEGEVNFAGRYTLEKKNQRLSDLVKMAGGVTDDAFVEGARLERRMNDTERARLQMALRTARNSRDSEDSVAVEKIQQSTIYNVGIHLEEALRNPGGDADIVLREGDRLVIPEYEGTVKISGDVMYPNTVAFENGKNYKWYVRQAGGFGERAKKRKSYVIYPNGTMAQVNHGAKITPGCEIIVPSKPKREAMTTAQWIGIGSSAASIGTMIATIIYMITK
jgi:protein involved in polysaccharide export with SLBB domain